MARAVNTRRGIRRICLVLTAIWIMLVLAYPFYSRRQYVATLEERLDAFYQACVDETNETSAGDYLAERKRCDVSRQRLAIEAFSPEINAYQWFVRPSTGRIWLPFNQRTDQRYTLEFLKADIRGFEKLSPQGLPASIVFTAALVLPPLFVYYLLIGGIGLVGWISRGFTSSDAN